MGIRVAAILAATMFTGAAEAQSHRYATVFAGTMTAEQWDDVFRPSELKFADSNLIGLAAGFERQIGDSRFWWGLESQIVGHFGAQDHFEANVPFVLRYRPFEGWWRFDSFGFGLGLSHATDVPEVELARTGQSQRNFVFWKAELAFDVSDGDDLLLVGLHHRSDGYGLFENDSGSTAITVGWRRGF